MRGGLELRSASCRLIKYIGQLSINRMENECGMKTEKIFRKERKECRGLALKTVSWIKVLDVGEERETETWGETR